jgi:hypothetical protein
MSQQPYQQMAAGGHPAQMQAHGQYPQAPPVAQMGQPVLMAPPQASPGVLTIVYEPKTACGKRRGQFDIEVSGTLVGTVPQGGQAQYPVHAGRQRVALQRSGFGGALTGFLSGNKDLASAVVNVQPGQQVQLTIAWEDQCCETRNGGRVMLR